MSLQPQNPAEEKAEVGGPLQPHPFHTVIVPKVMASDSLLHLAQEHHVGSRSGQGGGASNAGRVTYAQGQGLAHVLPVDLLMPCRGTFQSCLVPCGGHTTMN